MKRVLIRIINGRLVIPLQQPPRKLRPPRSNNPTPNPKHNNPLPHNKPPLPRSPNNIRTVKSTRQQSTANRALTKSSNQDTLITRT